MLHNYNRLLRLAFFGSVVLTLIGFALPTLKANLLCVLAGALLTYEFQRGLSFLEPIFENQAKEQLAWFDGMPEKFLPLAIAGSAGISLALELSIIRWQGTIFEFFAFYKNYGLLACFAGLGLGYALSRNREVLPLMFAPALCAWQFGLLIFLRHSPKGEGTFSIVPFREQLSMGLREVTDEGTLGCPFALSSRILLTALALFCRSGQLCGRLMERRSQLSSYGWNLAGSLCGVVLVFVTSFLWTPPVVWFGLCFLGLLFFFSAVPRRCSLVSPWSSSH